MSVVRLVGKIILIDVDKDFNFYDDVLFKRSLLALEECFEIGGSFIDGTYTVTFRSSAADDELERRVANIVKNYQYHIKRTDGD